MVFQIALALASYFHLTIVLSNIILTMMIGASKIFVMFIGVFLPDLVLSKPKVAFHLTGWAIATMLASQN